MVKDSHNVLLHCCCAPCSSAIIEWMLEHDIRPTLYYCNPNIYPLEEYLIRKNECNRYAHSLGLDIIDADYDHESWLLSIRGLEREPERGRRCLQCFKLRLFNAAKIASDLGFSTFTTTLASSRWKSLDQINAAGHWAAARVKELYGRDVIFDDRNWRKGGLQQRRNELLKINGFYNQLYCGCEFSLVTMRCRFLPEVASTNSWILDTLARGVEMVDESVVYTMRQTAGRGQVGNVWESEPDKNITFSMLLYPTFLPIREQFLISEICSLGVVDGIIKLAKDKNIDVTELNLSIKWPNDIYAGDLKLCGILIENKLVGSVLASSVLGVGLNVNQETWVGSAPNPVSLKLLEVESSPREVLDYVTSAIKHLYESLRDSSTDSCLFVRVKHQIHNRFKQSLYRKDGFHPYYDPQLDEHFCARIADIDSQGPISLELNTGEVRKYSFKEVQFVLPCGITKE